MKILVKRVYAEPAKSDGKRILVDRLWPRGLAKETAQLDAWLKILTPSNNLRKWFHQDRTHRYQEFTKRYAQELKDNKVEIKTSLPKTSTLTLATAVKLEDMDRSHIPTLLKFLNSLA